VLVLQWFEVWIKCMEAVGLSQIQMYDVEAFTFLKSGVMSM
jgi:hypothetical protein